ncbi:hypothetical protein FKM82_024701 [Ascaphus truei]
MGVPRVEGEATRPVGFANDDHRNLGGWGLSRRTGKVVIFALFFSPFSLPCLIQALFYVGGGHQNWG